MNKIIIFDFDGVIIDTHDLQIKSLRETYQRTNTDIVPKYEEFFRESGDSISNIFKKIGLPQSAVSIYQQVSRDNIGMVKVHNDMDMLLKKINQYSCKCALCTGKERSRTIEILDRLQLRDCFNTVVCSDDVKFPKPHPESIVKIMEFFNAAPHETIMIGDAVNDIICAKNAGVYSVAVTWGDADRNDLINASPDILIDSVDELERVIFTS